MCSRARRGVGRPFANPITAARKLIEIASGIEPVQEAASSLMLVNKPFSKMGGSGDEFRTGIALAKERGWIELHESGTFVRLTTAGSEPFAS